MYFLHLTPTEKEERSGKTLNNLTILQAYNLFHSKEKILMEFGIDHISKSINN